MGESEQMGALLIGVEKITYIINRCKIYEILYGQEIPPGRASENLQSALVALYSTILHFVACANRLYGKNTAVRSVYALFNSDILNKFITDLHEREIRVENEAHNCDRMNTQAANSELRESVNELKSLLARLEEPIIQIDRRVAAHLEKLEESEQLTILKWTSDIQYTEHHKSVNQRRAPSTCQWLLMRSEYRKWRRSDSSMVLWLHGIRETAPLMSCS